MGIILAPLLEKKIIYWGCIRTGCWWENL